MRITGGTFRSRTLLAPKGEKTRPTSDRVREALFSMLASDGLLFEGARVLDLYAGTGALAFEALSRGAETAVLVEEAAPALRAIRDNARSLGVEARVTVVRGPVEKMLARVEGPFDLVLCDPPYVTVRDPSFSAVLASAAERITPEGGLVLEHDASDAPTPPEGLVHDRSRRHGDTTLSFFRKSS